MECLICGNKNFIPYYYPPTIFNSKTFRYYECSYCHSAQVNPIPDKEDMKMMYGSDDHSYLASIKDGEFLNFNIKYAKYNHQKFQLQFFKKFDYRKYGNTLLDVGCGSGFYMNNARNFGFSCWGLEFDTEFAELLRKKTGLDIYSFEEFGAIFPEGKQFDIIHLGHVLEHSTEPKKFMHNLRKFAHENTVFVIDGPLEKNKCLSRFFIKWGSVLRKKTSNTYAPQHITFTNSRSQLLFFEKIGFQKVNYTVTEQLFPFPSTAAGQNLKNKLLHFMALISVNLSKVIPDSGNIFHYAGRIK